MENERITENEINIFDMLFILKKNLGKIIISAVVMACLFLAYTITLVTPIYSSTAELLIKGINAEAMSIYPDSTSRVMLVNNSIEVLNGTEVMQEVIDELNLKVTPEILQQAVTISSPMETQVLKISVISPDPNEAHRIASKFAEIAHEALAESVGVSALSTLEEPKTPTVPVSPSVLKNTVLGGLAGAFISALLCILFWFVNNKIYTSTDVERALGLTVFSSIPLVGREITNQEEETNAKEEK